MKSVIITSPVAMAPRQNLELKSGDTVRVWQNIVELKTGKGADKKAVTLKNARKQAFEGLVLAVKHGNEAGATFTVRKVSSGVGVEKIFPLYSPMIESIEILRRASTRRSKLYFIRTKASRDQKRAMRKSVQVNISSLASELETQPDTTEVPMTPPDVEVTPSHEENPSSPEVEAAAV